ncbi:MAG: response regulator [Betaproteobacteria bacterium]
MSDRYRIAIVEDTAAQRLLLTRLLAKKYNVSEYASGQDFLGDNAEFDAILLDIEMPGIDGYETCRCMRSGDGNADTPVLFVSGHNTPEDRIQAYEAGGDHFLSKPINIGELNHKIESVIAHRNALRELKSQSNWAQQVAFSAMAGMGGLGVIIEFFRKSAKINDYQSLADLVVESLKAWELRAGVQLRGLAGEVETSTDPIISPLQASVMATMRNMGRIFELKSRAVINFDHISILVYNMPADDPEKAGRMRDNLAWIGEGVDTCIANMDALNSRTQKIDFLGDKIDEITDLMQRAAVSDTTNRNLAQKLAIDVLEGLAVSVKGFSLTNIQNEYVISAVQEGVDELNTCFEDAALIQRDFSDILFRLQTLASGEKVCESGVAGEFLPPASVCSLAKGDGVVLF